MPNVSERDYSKLASAAAKDLVDHQIDLNESVDKLAASRSMNDEQLTRLCEATNNAAFNALFEAKGKVGSADRLVEFKVASAKEILQKRVGAEKTASPKEMIFDEAWERRELRGQARIETFLDEAAPFDKTASEALATSSQLRRLAVQDGRAFDKAIEHLRIEKIGAELELEDASRTAASCFRGLYEAPEFPRFEKEAMAIHGDDADAILDGMRETLRLPAVRRNYAKTASMIVMDDKTAAHKAFARAVVAQKRLADIQTTLARHGRG
jgi:hypothetical protein